MKNKFILLLFIMMNFILLPAAFASDNVIFDSTTITAEQAKNLNLSIPLDLKPSFQSMTINVWDSNNVESTKTVLFCKDMKGVIHWDNKCPDLIPAISPQALERITLRADLPKYDPASEPQKTTKTVVIAIAALTLLGGGSMKTLASSRKTSDSNDSPSQGSITQTGDVDLSSLAVTPGRGDLASHAQTHITEKAHHSFIKWAKKVSGPSPILTVVLSDANYLRAMIGGFAYILYPAAVVVGYLASVSAHKQALPPSLLFVILFAVFGTLDAFAGLLVAVAFMVPIIISGNVNNFTTAFTLIGISQVAISPMLIAINIRPLRRRVTDFASFWEKMTDFILASILGGWAVEAIVEGLPGLAGVQLAIANHGRLIGIWVAGLIFLRYSLEETATYLFPKKFAELAPSLNHRKKKHLVLSMILKIATFGIVAVSFIGFNLFFITGLVMYALPLILSFVHHKFPKKSAIKKWSPKGVVGIVVMTSFGTSLGIIVQKHIQDARVYMLAAFVLLSLPGFLLSILGFFGADPEKAWNEEGIGKIFYRLMGVVFFVLLLITIHGNNLFGFLIK